MENRKGFTIVEIIICLTIILLIAGITIGLTVANQKAKEEKIVEVTKKIQEAAGVYLSINKEIDDSIEQNILKGGTGYVIPLQTLYDEGYIGENHIKTLKENIENFNISKHYMLAAAFSNNPECNNGQSTITIEASYMLESSTNYYLCNFTTEKIYVFYDLDGGHFNDPAATPVQMYVKGSNIDLEDSEVIKGDVSNIKYEFNGWYKEKNCSGEKVTSLNNLDNNVVYACYKKTETEIAPTYKTIITSTKFTNNFDKIAISEEACRANGIDPKVGKDNIICNENGIYTYYNQESGVTYYYARGAVKNNYLKFKNKMWRIMWISDDNKMKIVLDDEVKVKLNDDISLNAGEILYHVTDSKVSKNISLSDYNNLKLYSRYDITLDFWYTSRNNARIYESLSDKTTIEREVTTQHYRTTYDLDKTIDLYDTTLFSIYNYTGNYQYNKDKNIYYKTLYDLTNSYNDSYIYNIQEFCAPRDLRVNNSTSLLSCNKNLNTINYVTKTSKVSYVTMDELKMAGIGGNNGSYSVLDTYILPVDSNSYYIADYYSDMDGDTILNSNYYVSKNGVNRGRNFTTENEMCLHSKISYSSSPAKVNDKNYYVFYKNGICNNAYCATANPCSYDRLSSTSGTYTDNDYYIYQHNSVSTFTFYANAVKPALIINLNEIKLSNNNGTNNDPYELIK